MSYLRYLIFQHDRSYTKLKIQSSYSNHFSLGSLLSYFRFLIFEDDRYYMKLKIQSSYSNLLLYGSFVSYLRYLHFRGSQILYETQDTVIIFKPSLYKEVSYHTYDTSFSRMTDLIRNSRYSYHILTLSLRAVFCHTFDTSFSRMTDLIPNSRYSQRLLTF